MIGTPCIDLWVAVHLQKLTSSNEQGVGLVLDKEVLMIHNIRGKPPWLCTLQAVVPLSLYIRTQGIPLSKTLSMAGGYGALAKMMASHRNQEVFRKFSTLNLEIMLHMQAELLHLELVIDEARKSDKIGDFDRGWLKCAKDMSQEDIQEIFERSRTLMKQYRMFCFSQENLHRDGTDSRIEETALRTTQINALQSPRNDDLELRRCWYDHKAGGDDFLRGLEAGIFREPEMETDVMVLSENPGSEDPLSSFLGEKVVPLYHRMLGQRIHRSMPEEFGHTWDYAPEMLVRIGNTVCMLLSAVLPALSILVLVCVQSMAARLTAICLMSLTFSVIMSVVAQRRADVFMSTTAFAAVLVVFVGSSNVMDR